MFDCGEIKNTKCFLNGFHDAILQIRRMISKAQEKWWLAVKSCFSGAFYCGRKAAKGNWMQMKKDNKYSYKIQVKVFS